MERISFDEYFMKMSELVSERATCLRRKVGAVIVKDKSVVSTGYNGPPRGCPSCDEKGGCLREKLKVPSGQRHELCRAAHAEANALAQAAKLGNSTEGATLYCTTFPCSLCVKLIINSGIKEIVYVDGYPDDLTTELVNESGHVKMRKIEMGADKTA